VHQAVEIYRSFAEIPHRIHLVSIGTFDGVHLGHQYLLSQASERARQLDLPLLVVTFEPNPAEVLRPDAFRGRLNTPVQKIERLAASGAKEILVLPFTHGLAQQTPEQFLGELVAAASPAEVWVGEEFALGHNREGTVDRLAEIGRELGFRLNAVSRRALDGAVISSSRIRQYILAGELGHAEMLLGYPYRISGEVIHGAEVGRTIGFPTANVEPPELLVPAPDGIYATHAVVDGDDTVHEAMTYIGTRPALNTGARQIETHILDYRGDLYGKTLHTDFHKRLRPDANFASVDALVEQLKRDEIDARNALTALRESPEASSIRAVKR
jgi:riboflavin kinase/FMN adenylyltransferase